MKKDGLRCGKCETHRGLFFCAQVLDFYRRPMLYYYNDCEYVHFQHGGLRGEKLFGYRRGSPEQDTI